MLLVFFIHTQLSLTSSQYITAMIQMKELNWSHLWQPKAQETILSDLLFARLW